MRLLTALTLALLAAPATAQTQPDYSDNRSTAADVVQSLYNAINRQEYLRGYSYYKSGAAPAYASFAAGYAKTLHVDLRLGEVTAEGAAGSTHSAVPVALRARTADGQTTVYVGCYTLTQVNPAIQEVAPFRPIQIDGGHLQRTPQPFANAMGTCP